MTAPARPQHVVDAAETAVASHRATVAELLTAYRDITARLGDPLAAYAGVAGAAYTEMCARQLSQVLAAAVQMLDEQRDAAELMPFPAEDTVPRRWRDADGEFWQERPDGLIALETDRGLSGLFVCTDEANLADTNGPIVEVTR